MKSNHIRACAAGMLLLVTLGMTGVLTAAPGADATGSPPLIQPADLVKLLQASASARPLILQVGFRTLYEQAHIPGSEYIGPSSEGQGLRTLHKRVQALPRTRSIVLYCGCCPWSHCPNVRPAYQELRAMGFRNVRLLFIAHNFGTDWVDKGYPVTRSE